MARDSSIPSFLISQDGLLVNLTISGSDALLEDQGYTYNQAGFSYDQLGVMYGGVYNTDEDVVPMVLSAQIQQPMNLFMSDIYTNIAPPPPNFQKVVGVGFWMYVAQV